MIYILIAALVVINVAYVLVLDRKDRRHDSQVGRLLQRIQAPEQAVLEHSAVIAPKQDGPLYTNEFTDDFDSMMDTLRPGEVS